jgi:hypothetical protein
LQFFLKELSSHENLQMVLDTMEFSVAREIWAIYSRYPAHHLMLTRVVIWAYPNCYEDDPSGSICHFHVSQRDHNVNFYSTDLFRQRDSLHIVFGSWLDR